MERLTHPRNNGIKTGYWSPSRKDELIERLAEYEDTELTPQEIISLRAGTILQILKGQEWIPVEERLPEPEQDVIISEKTGIVTTGIYTERYGMKADRGFICSNRFMMVGEVVAWMPLPEASTGN